MWLELHMIATSKRNYEFKTTYDYDFNSLLMFGITHIRDLTHEHWKKVVDLTTLSSLVAAP